MLVLTRFLGEKIMVGDDVEIKVVELAGNKVRLGITAPTDKKVWREEIYRKVKEEEKNGNA